LKRSSPSAAGNVIHERGIMGAEISITGPEKGMYLVIGGSVSPEKLIRQNEGEIIMKLSSRAALAMLLFSRYLILKKHPCIKKIGPVTVNVERFNKAVEMLTKNVKNGHQV